MKVIDAIKKGNSRKESIKVQRIIDVKMYYLSLYRIEMLKLYDYGYISDPTMYIEKELYGNISDMQIVDMFDMSGGINMTSAQTLFAYLKHKENDEVKDFLWMLYNTLRYREYCQDIDKFYEDQCITVDLVSIKPRIDIYLKGACPSNRSNYTVSKGVASCISKFGTSVRSININEYLWALAMNELGVPREEWFIDGLMDGSLSHSEELQCIEGILGGHFKVSGGKYTNLLRTWLEEHKWASKFTSSESLGLYEYVFSGDLNNILTLYEILLTAIDEDQDATFLTLHRANIYYSVSSDTIKVPLGVFVVGCDAEEDEKVLPTGNVVFGYSGEVYSKARLDEDNIAYVGCPLVLYSDRSSKKYYYDIEQTDITYSSWFKSSGNVDIEFSDEDAKSLESVRTPLGAIQSELWKAYLKSLTSINNLIFTIPVCSSKDLEKAKYDIFKKIEEAGR